MACWSSVLCIMLIRNPEFLMLIFLLLVLWIFSISYKLSHSIISLLQGVSLVILLINVFFPVTFEGFHLYWKNTLNILKVGTFEFLAWSFTLFVIISLPMFLIHSFLLLLLKNQGFYILICGDDLCLS